MHHFWRSTLRKHTESSVAFVCLLSIPAVHATPPKGRPQNLHQPHNASEELRKPLKHAINPDEALTGIYTTTSSPRQWLFGWGPRAHAKAPQGRRQRCWAPQGMKFQLNGFCRNFACYRARQGLHTTRASLCGIKQVTRNRWDGKSAEKQSSCWKVARGGGGGCCALPPTPAFFFQTAQPASLLL